MQNNILEAAYAYGVSPTYLMALAQVESGGRLDARNPNSTATGPFQFIDKTWLDERTKMGDVDAARLQADPSYRQEILSQRTDPAVASKVAAQFSKRNADYLRSLLGRDASDVELYMAHFLGPQGARTFFERQGADGAAPAADALPLAAAVNQPVFFNRDGSPRSYNDILTKFGEKFPVSTGQPPLIDMGNVAQRPDPMPVQDAPAQEASSAPATAQRRDNAMISEGLRPQGDLDAARMLFSIGSGFLGGNGFFDGAARASAGAANAITAQQQNQASQMAAFTRLVASGVDPRQASMAIRGGGVEALANAQITRPANAQQGNTYYTPDGQVVREIFNKRTGMPEYHNAQSGQVSNTLPRGSFRVEDSAFRTINKQSGADVNAAYEAANDAPSRVAQLERLRSVGQNIVGPDALAQGGRAIAEFLGIKVGNFDPANISQFKKEIADMAVEAAQRMRGQGQITENERKLLMDTLPNLDSNPQAFNTVIDILKRAEQRKIEQVEAWENASPDDKRDGWSAFQFRYRRRLEQASPPASQGQAAPTSGGNATSTGVQWKLKSQ